MGLPEIVSQQEWVSARTSLLTAEKEMTRARDALIAARRRLPMVQVTKDYRFQGPDGAAQPGGSVRGPQPADRRALHVRPRVGGRLLELHRRGR